MRFALFLGAACREVQCIDWTSAGLTSSQCRLASSGELHLGGDSVDNGFMRLRATCAGLLTLVLLCFSSASTACETRCEIKGAKPGCHEREALSFERQRMSGMADTAMLGMDASTAAPDAIVVPSPTCAQHGCVHDAAVLSDEGARAADLRPHTGTAKPSPEIMPAAARQTRPASRRSPPLQQASPVRLRTTLRV